MNFIDALIVGAGFVAAFRGYRLGLIREVFGFAGWVAGVLGALRWMPMWVPGLSRTLDIAPAVAGLILFVGIFAGVYVGCRLAGWVLGRLVHMTPLASVDRTTGFALGAAEGAALAAAILYVLEVSKLVPSALPAIESSVLARPLVRGAERAVTAVRDVDPEEMLGKVGPAPEAGGPEPDEKTRTKQRAAPARPREAPRASAPREEPTPAPPASGAEPTATPTFRVRGSF